MGSISGYWHGMGSDWVIKGWPTSSMFDRFVLLRCVVLYTKTEWKETGLGRAERGLDLMSNVFP